MRCVVTATPDVWTPASWSSLCDRLRKTEPDLVLLPELPFSPWLCGSTVFDHDTFLHAVEEHEKGVSWFCEMPWATVTTVPLWRGDLRINQPVVCSDGEMRPIGDGKVLLPDEERFFEQRWFDAARTTTEVCTVAGARVGVLPCSDLWALERVRELATQGAHLVLTPRATLSPAADRWLTLGRAAAMAGGVFWLSSTRIEPDDPEGFGGGAWVVGPSGDVLAQLEGEEVLDVEIETSVAEAAKTSYPCNLFT